MLSSMSGLFSRLMSALLSRKASSSGSGSQASSSGSSHELSSNNPWAVTDKDPLVWGKKLTAPERLKVREIARALQSDPNNLMGCMGFETGGTFLPDVQNGLGSGATGLIQFMPKTAQGLGTSIAALRKMTVLEQLDWVHTYFKPYAGRLNSLSDMYMAILWPAAVGKPEGYKLWEEGSRPKTYAQNIGLDLNKDRTITKAEATEKVRQMMEVGRRPENYWPGEVA